MNKGKFFYRCLSALAVISAIVCAAQPKAGEAATSSQARFPNATPSWDDRFGPPGIQDGDLTTTAVAANGDVYVGGVFNIAGGVPAKSIARWDGRRWHALGAGLQGGGETPNAMVADGNRLYVVGGFEQAGTANAVGLAQWDGNAWSPIGSGEGPTAGDLKGWLYAAAMFKGKLIVGGYFDKIDGVAANNIAQWDGTRWQPLGLGVGKLDVDGNFSSEGEVRALAVDGDALVVGGKFALAGGAGTQANSVAKWDGEKWAAFGAGEGMTATEGNDEAQPGLVASLAAKGGVVYAGGLFTQAGSAAVKHIAVWQNGSWSSVGAGLNEPQFNDKPVVNALVISGTRVYAGGIFTGTGSGVGSAPIALLAKWDGANWSAVGANIQQENFDQVNALTTLTNGEVLIAGKFRQAGNKRVDNIARWNGTEWLTLGLGAMRQEYSDQPARFYAMAADEAGRVYVGGTFTRAGGVASNGLAMWDGARWHNLGSTNAAVYAIAVSDDDVYIGGTFTEAGGVAASRVARWNRASGQWSALGEGINDTVHALTIGHGVLYAGGGFTSAGNVTAQDVAYWDGEQWHALGTTARIFEVGNQGGEVGTQAFALAVRGDSLFIGGHFQTIQYGTNTANLSSFTVVHNVVEWDYKTDTWYWLGDAAKRGVSFGGFSGLQIDVRALTVISDVVYVGGRFNQAGAASANGLAAWNAAAERWQPAHPSAGGVGGFDDASVWGLTGYGSTLFAVGHFTSAGNTPARYIAQLDTKTGAWSALGNGLSWYNDRFTEALSVVATANGAYVGGDFDKADGIPSSGFAHWQAALDGDTPTPTPPPTTTLPVKVFLPAVFR